MKLPHIEKVFDGVGWLLVDIVGQYHQDGEKWDLAGERQIVFKDLQQGLRTECHPGEYPEYLGRGVALVAMAIEKVETERALV